MITRPVYIPTDSPPYFAREDYQIPYGTPEQMIAALHQAFQQRHPGAKVLEISSKSDRPEGKALSAFNLPYTTDDGRKTTVEGAFQAGKMFGDGSQIGFLPPAEAKRAARERMKAGGGLRGFRLGGQDYPLDPPTAFYDWIYTNALAQSPRLGRNVLDGGYTAFTDIMFDPQRSKNCQAEAVARFAAMSANGTLEENMRDFDSFAGGLGGSASPAQPQPQPQPQQAQKGKAVNHTLDDFFTGDGQQAKVPENGSEAPEEQPAVQEEEVWEPPVEEMYYKRTPEEVPADIFEPVAARRAAVKGPVVREFSELQIPTALRSALAETLPYGYMFEAQAEAVSRVIDGSNVVASIPTAGGKSVIGYIALFNRLLSRGEKGMYIVPFKALAEEKKEEIENLGKRLGVKVCVMTGDHKDTTSVPYDTQVLLVTAEKADSLLRSRDPWITGRYKDTSPLNPGVVIDPLGTIVADEVHTIADADRGPTYEAVLTQLRTELPNSQIVAISGTIPNAADLADWLGAETVISDVRPTKLRNGVYVPGSTPVVRYDDGTEEAIGSSADRDRTSADIAKRAARAHKQVLIFTSSKRRTEELAYLLRTRYKVNSGIHHAGLSAKSRKQIEAAYKAGKISTLVATPTLAAGVNLPADISVIYDTDRYDADLMEYVPLATSEIRQMQGRAGRFGVPGESIILSNIGKDAEASNRTVTPAEIERKYIYGDVEPVQSAMELDLDFVLLGLISRKPSSSELDLCHACAQTLWGRTSEPYKIYSDVHDALLSLTEKRLIGGLEMDSVACTPAGRAAASLCIKPRTAELMTTLSSAVETLKTLDPRFVDAYILEVLAQSKEIEGLALATKDKDILASWDAMLREYYAVSQLLPEGVGEVPEDRLRAAIAAKTIMTVEPKKRKDWAQKHGVYLGDLYQLIDKMRWMSHSLNRIAEASGSKCPYFATVEPRLIDPEAWEEGTPESLGAIAEQMGVLPQSRIDAIADETERAQAQERRDQRISDLIDLDIAMHGEDPTVLFAPLYADDTKLYTGGQYPHELAAPTKPLDRQAQISEPEAIPGWNWRSEAYALRRLRSSPRGADTFSPEKMRRLDQDLEDETYITIDRVVRNVPQNTAEKNLADWWMKNQAAPDAFQLLKAGTTRALRYARMDQAAKTTGVFDQGIDPGVCLKAAEDHAKKEAASAEKREAQMKEYYAKVAKIHKQKMIEYHLTPSTVTPLVRPSDIGGSNIYYSPAGGLLDQFANLIVHEVGEVGQDEYSGPYMKEFDGMMTTKMANDYSKQVTRHMNNGEPACWNTFNGGGIVITVREDLPVEEKAEAIAALCKELAANERIPQTWSAITMADPALAKALSNHLPDKKVVIAGKDYSGENPGYPIYEPDTNGPQPSTRVNIPWVKCPNNILRADNGDAYYYWSGPNSDALAIAAGKPRIALLGLKNVNASYESMDDLRNLIASHANDTIVCDIPTADSGLREVFLNHPGSVMFTITGSNIGAGEEEFVRAMQEKGSVVVRQYTSDGPRDRTASIQTSLANQSYIVRLASSSLSDPVTAAVIALSKKGQVTGCLPGNERILRALDLGQKAVSTYVLGSDPAAELTLTLEHMGYSIKKISAFIKACDYNVARANELVASLDGYAEAHEKALSRLNIMKTNGVGLITRFDTSHPWLWSEYDPVPSVTVYGDLSLLDKAHRVVADGSESLYDFKEDLDRISESNPAYSRAVGMFMNLVTSYEFSPEKSDSVLLTGTNSAGATAADEAVYRVNGGQLIKYLDIPIEDLMDLAGPDSALMQYVREKNFKNPNSEEATYDVKLVGKDGTLDPEKIFGIEHTLKENKPGEYTRPDGTNALYSVAEHTYQEGDGVKAFRYLCNYLDKRRTEAISAAEAEGKPIPTELSIKEGRRFFVLPLHPTHSYKDLLMDSLALKMADNHKGCLLIAPSGYESDRKNKVWTPARDLSDVMLTTNQYLAMAGSKNRQHPERLINGQVLVLPVNTDNRSAGSRDMGDLWCAQDEDHVKVMDVRDDVDYAQRQSMIEYSVGRFINTDTPEEKKEKVQTESSVLPKTQGDPSGVETPVVQDSASKQPINGGEEQKDTDSVPVQAESPEQDGSEAQQ